MKTSTLVKTITAAAVAFTFIAAVSIQPTYALDSAVNTRASAKGRYLDNDSRVGAEKMGYQSQNVATVRQSSQSGYANVSAQPTARASEKGRYLDNDSRVGAEKRRFESQNVGAGSNGSATYTGSAYKQPRASVKGPYLNTDSGTQAEKVLSGWARFQR